MVNLPNVLREKLNYHAVALTFVYLDCTCNIRYEYILQIIKLDGVTMYIVRSIICTQPRVHEGILYNNINILLTEIYNDVYIIQNQQHYGVVFKLAISKVAVIPIHLDGSRQ